MQKSLLCLLSGARQNVLLFCLCLPLSLLSLISHSTFFVYLFLSSRIHQGGRGGTRNRSSSGASQNRTRLSRRNESKNTGPGHYRGSRVLVSGPLDHAHVVMIAYCFACFAVQSQTSSSSSTASRSSRGRPCFHRRGNTTS